MIDSYINRFWDKVVDYYDTHTIVELSELFRDNIKTTLNLIWEWFYFDFGFTFSSNSSIISLSLFWFDISTPIGNCHIPEGTNIL